MIHIGDIIAFASNARLLGPEYWGKKLKVLRIAPDGSLDIEILEEITRGTQLVHFMGSAMHVNPRICLRKLNPPAMNALRPTRPETSHTGNPSSPMIYTKKRGDLCLK